MKSMVNITLDLSKLLNKGIDLYQYSVLYLLYTDRIASLQLATNVPSHVYANLLNKGYLFEEDADESGAYINVDACKLSEAGIKLLKEISNIEDKKVYEDRWNAIDEIYPTFVNAKDGKKRALRTKASPSFYEKYLQTYCRTSKRKPEEVHKEVVKGLTNYVKNTNKMYLKSLVKAIDEGLWLDYLTTEADLDPRNNIVT